MFMLSKFLAYFIKLCYFYQMTVDWLFFHLLCSKCVPMSTHRLMFTNCILYFIFLSFEKFLFKHWSSLLRCDESTMWKSKIYYRICFPVMLNILFWNIIAWQNSFNKMIMKTFNNLLSVKMCCINVHRTHKKYPKYIVKFMISEVLNVISR